MMNVVNIFINRFRRAVAGLNLARAKPTILVKKLEERDRRQMLKHFLALDDADRLLRFGTVLPDNQVATYVQKIDFLRDTVFGVYKNGFWLVAVGHLAFASKDAVSISNGATGQEFVAEFGISVDRSARGWAWARICSSARSSIAAMPAWIPFIHTACR